MLQDNASPLEGPARPTFFYYGPLLCDALEELAMAADKVVAMGDYLRTHPETLRIERFAASHKIDFSHLADTDTFKALDGALKRIDNMESIGREDRPTNRDWALAFGSVQECVGEFIVFLGDKMKSMPLRAAYAVVDGTSLQYKGPDINDALMTMGELSVVVNECIKRRLAELEKDPLPCAL